MTRLRDGAGFFEIHSRVRALGYARLTASIRCPFSLHLWERRCRAGLDLLKGHIQRLPAARLRLFK